MYICAVTQEMWGRLPHIGAEVIVERQEDKSRAKGRHNEAMEKKWIMFPAAFNC